MLFSGWADIGRIVVVGVLAYTALLLFVRISGKRTLSKLNAFDFVITVALGSTLSSVVLDKTVSLAEGVLAIGLLILLQYGISWSTVRWGPVERVVTSRPVLVVHRGVFLTRAMRDERVMEADVRAAIRASGKNDLREIVAVVLENDGSLSVISEGSSVVLGPDG